MHISIDRKPENGCKIHNMCCGHSGIMMCLKLAKTAEKEANHARKGEDRLLHGTCILLFLINLWAYSRLTAVCDSCFASVGAAKALQDISLGFIVIAKTATQQFPMAYLSGLELRHRGKRKG